MGVILTPKQAKKARVILGLSQGSVATVLEINRSYLSQFENGKYLLSDSELDTLKNHLESKGYEFDKVPVESSPSTPAANQNNDDGIRIIDGFLIPDWLEDDYVEDLLNEYQNNIKTISRLCVYNIKTNHTEKPFFGDPYIDGIAHRDLTRDALILMARNYNIIEELRGHDSCLPTTNIEKANTTGEFIGYEFNQLAK